MASANGMTAFCIRLCSERYRPSSLIVCTKASPLGVRKELPNAFATCRPILKKTILCRTKCCAIVVYKMLPHIMFTEEGISAFIRFSTPRER